MKYIYWQDEGMWLGYLEDYPDYMTQVRTICYHNIYEYYGGKI